jgi:hypothetical protein
MDREHAAGGGWEAAIDAGLAVRLLRPAVRAGISDPAHGAKLAARLQRATPPSLADDVARRYGSAALEGGRPPIVYAAPAAPTLGDASTAVPARGASPQTEPGGASEGAARPVVRAAERGAPPAFPPVQSVGSGPVQRMSDPEAAAPLVVAPRRVAAGTPKGTAGPAADPASAAIPISVPPVVKPAPTRLQRQLAAEHAEAAAPIVSTLPLVRPAGSSPTRRRDASALLAEPGARTGAGEAASPATSSVVQRIAAADGAGGTVSPSSDTIDLVQRVADPAGAVVRVEGRPVGEGSVAASPEVSGSLDRLRGQEDLAGSTTPVALPFASPATSTRGFGAPAADAALVVQARAAEAVAAPARGIVQRSADPAGAVMRVEGRPAGEGSAAGRSPAPRPVVAPRAGAAAAPVQRSLLGLAGMAAGGAARLAYAAASAADPASGGLRRAAATSTPPAGAPPAELPTLTAPGVEPAGPGPGTARLAEDVYQLLVRRLETERKQRGW